MLDNAALTSGPVIGVDKNALAQDEKAEDIHAFRVLRFDDPADMKGALQFWQAQSHSSEYLAMAKAFDDFGDELTVPRWVQGDGNVSDAAKTASGMSMLMAALSYNLAEMVKIFDDAITSPFIAALYFWNMPEYSADSPYWDKVTTGSLAELTGEFENFREQNTKIDNTDPYLSLIDFKVSGNHGIAPYCRIVGTTDSGEKRYAYAYGCVYDAASNTTTITIADYQYKKFILDAKQPLTFGTQPFPVSCPNGLLTGMNFMPCSREIPSRRISAPGVLSAGHSRAI